MYVYSQFRKDISFKLSNAPFQQHIFVKFACPNRTELQLFRLMPAFVRMLCVFAETWEHTTVRSPPKTSTFSIMDINLLLAFLHYRDLCCGMMG